MVYFGRVQVRAQRLALFEVFLQSVGILFGNWFSLNFSVRQTGASSYWKGWQISGPERMCCDCEKEIII